MPFVKAALKRCFPKTFSTESSIRRQIVTALMLVGVTILSLVFLLSLILMLTLKDNTLEVARASLEKQIQTNTKIMAEEIALAVQERLTFMGDSISMTVAKQHEALLKTYPDTQMVHAPNSQNNLPKLYSDLPVKAPKFASYREYIFGTFHTNDPNACSENNINATAVCKPSDFGDLSPPRSRLTNFLGSTDHSSVYLMQKQRDSDVKLAAQSDDTWANFCDPSLERGQIANTIMKNTELLDSDWKEIFDKGPDTTVMFYGSVQYKFAKPSAPQEYISVHRTYPGIIKTNPIPTDPYVSYMQ